VPHIHTEQVLDDIEHWQDEKEAAYLKRHARLMQIKAEEEKKNAITRAEQEQEKEAR
jgi:hypothetical protein